MKAYLFYRLCYVIVALLLTGEATHFFGSHDAKSCTDKDAVKLSARNYATEKLKNYTTMLDISANEMIVTDLGNDHYRVLAPVKLAYNTESNKVWYEVKLHFNNSNLKERVIDGFKRM
ncbi:hypothetical protein [Solitalea koreensis]|uniref:Uncharacterized protein n=1 Tax=Solitalea koreensis TaxID=543615 RepID=A0A521C6S5_9SPHI|nr:hypothetical protein [Solitalea koreensis]SMO55118.1 hypothetical protein SAMN06265350_103276 [Solitalea koreensis]